MEPNVFAVELTTAGEEPETSLVVPTIALFVTKLTLVSGSAATSTVGDDDEDDEDESL